MNREAVEAMVLEGQAEVLEAAAAELEKVQKRLRERATVMRTTATQKLKSAAISADIEAQGEDW